MGGKRGKFAENEKKVLKNTKKLQKNEGKKCKTWKKMRKIVHFEFFFVDALHCGHGLFAHLYSKAQDHIDWRKADHGFTRKYRTLVQDFKIVGRHKGLLRFLPNAGLNTQVSSMPFTAHPMSNADQ